MISDEPAAAAAGVSILLLDIINSNNDPFGLCKSGGRKMALELELSSTVFSKEDMFDDAEAEAEAEHCWKIDEKFSMVRKRKG